MNEKLPSYLFLDYKALSKLMVIGPGRIRVLNQLYFDHYKGYIGDVVYYLIGDRATKTGRVVNAEFNATMFIKENNQFKKLKTSIREPTFRWGWLNLYTDPVVDDAIIIPIKMLAL